MIDMKPLSVRLIDFNRAMLRSVKTKGHVRGTPGYFPDVEYLRDGSTKWDIYALGAIILELDIERDAYFGVKTTREGRFIINKYL